MSGFVGWTVSTRAVNIKAARNCSEFGNPGRYNLLAIGLKFGSYGILSKIRTGFRVAYVDRLRKAKPAKIGGLMSRIENHRKVF